MFEYCADPKALEGLAWLSCYVTTPKHMSFYSSFLVVMCLLALAAPLAMLFGFLGAIASRSSKNSIRILGKGYLAMIRGIPDIVFFLFIPIALDQAFEFLRHKILCPEFTEAVRQGNDFVVCKAAKLPLSTASEWVHDFYGFSLALLAFGFVFGAFTGNVLSGAMAAVPKSQLETGAAFGFSSKQIFKRILIPQMWIYALPGLSNLWMILIKATPLLFLLGIEDIVYWARELGGIKTGVYDYPHPDWRAWYFGVLMIFYLLLTYISQIFLDRLSTKLSIGQATMAGKVA
ncbi:MAG: ABC transporter permease subunit [Alphaproteobacteria bacterium]|jgi:polar amino acid transport system permease protein|nr:ABC transporter permease subunit [Alphaproteobacteria bacterium]